MAATHGEGVYGAGVAVTTPLEHRMAQVGSIVKTAANTIRPGLFWDGNPTVVSGRANMAYDVRAFSIVTSRGATAGAVRWANDAVVTVATTAAPGSNSRYDVVYAWHREFQLDGTNSDPVIGVVQGTAAASPTVPSLVAFPGAVELARILVPAGVTATNSGTTITQTSPFTTVADGIPVFRTTNERDLYVPLKVGDKSWVIADSIIYRWSGSAWKAWESDWITWSTPPTNITIGTGGSASSLQRYMYVNGRALIEYRFALGASGFAVGAAPYITLPFSVVLAVPRYSVLEGDGNIYDFSATANLYTKARVNDPSSNQVNISSYTGTFNGITSTAPITWGAGDIIQGKFWVDPA